MEIIAGLIIGLVLFCIPILSYRAGLQMGIHITKGKDIKPLRMDFNKPKLSKEDKKKIEEEQKIVNGINNLLSYNGEQQKKEGE